MTRPSVVRVIPTQTTGSLPRLTSVNHSPALLDELDIFVGQGYLSEIPESLIPRKKFTLGFRPPPPLVLIFLEVENLSCFEKSLATAL